MTVLPHATMFAMLQAYGAVAVGWGLSSGSCPSLTAVVGLFS